MSVPHKGDRALFWDPLAEFQLGHRISPLRCSQPTFRLALRPRSKTSQAKFSLPSLGFSPAGDDVALAASMAVGLAASSYRSCRAWIAGKWVFLDSTY